jgi:hypothetical protein
MDGGKKSKFSKSNEEEDNINDEIDDIIAE